MFIKADNVSGKLCKAFNKLQMDDIAVSKAVKHLRKLYETVEDSRFDNSKVFFDHLTHILRLPLSRGSSKDRMCTFDEKVFEVVCQFATSFLQSKTETEEGNDTEKNTTKETDLNETDLAELPPLLRDLFDWLLDHHEVESSGSEMYRM